MIRGLLHPVSSPRLRTLRNTLSNLQSASNFCRHHSPLLSRAFRFNSSSSLRLACQPQGGVHFQAPSSVLPNFRTRTFVGSALNSASYSTMAPDDESVAWTGTHFKPVQKFHPDFAVATVTQYESNRTGLRVAVVDTKSTKVAGEFCLATEIKDDSGAPHTLEHLVFMGSKSYPYRGILDKLATRSYSDTNAWTATDITCYSLDAAGWAGFAQLLPVYLEHILFPSLTDQACYTEVHHIDPTGNDAGVVYSEMQAIQNSPEFLMELEACRQVYPEGDGFRYETGGMMEALRVLTPERIRQFHKAMYQPKNLRLCITGQVDHKDLLQILERFENGILGDVPKLPDPFKRPWIDSKKTPPLESTTIRKIEFPEEDESMGEIEVLFFGPDFSDFLHVRALDVMLNYLASSPASVLPYTLVETEQLASAVWYSTEERPNILIRFNLASVATEKLEAVEKRLFEVLSDVASKPLDMDYLHDCMKRIKRQSIFAAETNPSTLIPFIISDHAYGNRDGSDLIEHIGSLKGYDVLRTWTESQWQHLIRKYFVDNKHASLLGVPSTALSNKLKDEEKVRVEKQVERLGPEGLKDLEKKLEDAKKYNDRPTPDGVLESFHVPSPDSIPFIKSVTARSGHARDMGKLDNEVQEYINKASREDLPLFIHFEHIPAKCVYVSLVLGTSQLPVELKPLLPLFMENFFSSPIVEDNGTRVEFEQVVKAMNKDTIVFGVEPGAYVGNSELIMISFSVEPEKYGAAVSWLQKMLFNSVFDANRLEATLSKLLADIPSLKRDGESMGFAIDEMIHWSQASSSRARSTLVKARYLKGIKQLLKENPSEVISRLEELRSHLSAFSNMRSYVLADVLNLPNPVKEWTSLISKVDSSQSLVPIPSLRDGLSEAALHPGKLGYIIPISTTDSSFAIFTSVGPQGYMHEKLPALMVAMSYLEKLGGPLMEAVRGSGLAYGLGFSHSKATGLIQLRIWRAPDSYKAYLAAHAVVMDIVDGKLPVEDMAVEGAISSIVMDFANEGLTIVTAARASFVNQVIKGIPKDYAAQILRLVKQVTPTDIKAVIRDYLLPVLTPGKANFVITCATAMEEGLLEGFTKAGFTPEVKKLGDFEEDYGLGVEVGEEDGEDGDSEMESVESESASR